MDATTTVERDRVSATLDVRAPAATLFAFVRRPANHAALSGDGTVRGTRDDEVVLGPGDRFGMSMRWGVPYVVSSRVVEFEQDRLLAWAHLGGHRWRWSFEPLDDDLTRVTETFDQSTSLAPWLLRLALDLPGGHEQNVRRSVENLARLATG